MARSRGVVIPISATDNSARAFESVNAQVARLREQVASLRAASAGAGSSLAEAGANMHDGWHSATTEVQATSAAVRTLEGNPGIRSIERFLVTIPGVGKALLAAFPVLGALAFANVVADGVEKLISMRDAALNAAAATRQASQEQHDKAVVAIDDITIENDKLQEQIDKIEKHPNNGLQSAIDDARKSCDQLIVSLEDAAKAEAALLKRNDVGGLAGFLSGEASTGQQDKELSADSQQLIEKARSLNAQYLEALSGTKNPDQVNALAAQRMKQIHDLFDPQIATMQAEAKRLSDEQAKATGDASEIEQMNPGGPLPRVIDNSKKIANVESEAQSYADQRNLELANVQHAQLEGTHTELADDKQPKPDRGAEEFASRIEEAQEKVTDAQRKATEQSASAAADAAKNRADAALAALDDQHKRELISDQDYYAQKLKIQTNALDQEEAANEAKQGALGNQIRGTIQKYGGADRGKPVEQLNDVSKITELQTQVNQLEQQRADIVEKRKKLEEESDAESFEAAKKHLDDAAKLAAEVEAIRGGSTSARLAQSDSQYEKQQKTRIVQGASPDEIADAGYQHDVGDADIVLRGAEDSQKNTDTGISTQRSAIQYQQASGQISAAEAQQELIELDKQEAAALQPVLAAYEQLAALNVDGAAEKVAALKEQIAELQQPISQVAAGIRSQLNSAFEELFVNMDKGKKAWSSFKKSIEGDVMKDTYQQAVEPLLQSAMSVFVPHTGGGSGAATGGKASTPTAASAIGGFFTKALGLPGTKAGVSGGGVQVQIINQSSTPVGGTASTQSSSQGGGSDMTEMLTPHVIQIVLNDLEHGGSINQAIAGGGMLTSS